MTADQFVLLLRRVRLDQHRSQTAVAASMGISKTQLCDYEGGRCRPGLVVLLCWAEALGFRLELVPVGGDS